MLEHALVTFFSMTFHALAFFFVLSFLDHGVRARSVGAQKAIHYLQNRKHKNYPTNLMMRVLGKMISTVAFFVVNGRNCKADSNNRHHRCERIRSHMQLVPHTRGKR